MMIKKMKPFMLITAIVIGFGVSLASVLPAYGAKVPYRGAGYSNDNLSSSNSGSKHDFPFGNRADTLITFRNAENVLPKTIYFNNYDNNGNWYPILTKGPLISSMDLSFRAKGYFWYRYSDTTFDYYKERSIIQRFLKINSESESTNGGDVAPVPIPGAAVLLASGLLGLVWLKQRRSKTHSI